MRDSDALYAAVGANIAEVREARGLTQKALASLVGLQRSSIANIERGKQKILLHMLYALARALERPVKELLPDATSVPTESEKEIKDLLKTRPRKEQSWLRSALYDPKRKR